MNWTAWSERCRGFRHVVEIMEPYTHTVHAVSGCHWPRENLTSSPVWTQRRPCARQRSLDFWCTLPNYSAHVGQACGFSPLHETHRGVASKCIPSRPQMLEPGRNITAACVNIILEVYSTQGQPRETDVASAIASADTYACIAKLGGNFNLGAGFFRMDMSQEYVRRTPLRNIPHRR